MTGSIRSIEVVNVRLLLTQLMSSLSDITRRLSTEHFNSKDSRLKDKQQTDRLNALSNTLHKLLSIVNRRTRHLVLFIPLGIELFVDVSDGKAQCTKT